MKKNIKVIILSLLIISSTLFEITKTSIKYGSSYAYLIKPVIWIFIGIIAFVFFKNEKEINYKYKKEVNFAVLVSSLIYFLTYFILGYIKGFANNPYDTSLKGIMLNLWTFVPILFVREYVRYYMINNCEQKRVLLWTLYISLIFVFINLIVILKHH